MRPVSSVSVLPPHSRVLRLMSDIFASFYPGGRIPGGGGQGSGFRNPLQWNRRRGLRRSPRRVWRPRTEAACRRIGPPACLRGSGGRGRDLAAQAEGLDQLLIAVRIGRLQMVQERPARGDQLEQAAARVVVLLVGLE